MRTTQEVPSLFALKSGSQRDIVQFVLWHRCRKGFRSGGRGLYNNGLELKQTILSLFTEINSISISSSLFM